MGNIFSVPPVMTFSFGDCVIDGKLDINKYQIYFIIKKKREREGISFDFDHKISKKEVKPPEKRIRSVKKHELIITHPNVSTTYMEPINFLWYTLYVQSQPSSRKTKKYF